MAANPHRNPHQRQHFPIGTPEEEASHQQGRRQRRRETGDESLQGFRRTQPGSDAMATQARPDQIRRYVTGPDDGQHHDQLAGFALVPGQQRHGQTQIQERHEAGRSRGQGVAVVDDPIQMRGEQAEAGPQQVGHHRTTPLIPHPGEQQARDDGGKGFPDPHGRQQPEQLQGLR